ncbi:MAG TPA: septum formation initiator family protein [Candidatus Methylomirabilis sp.]|nr:septum formation initiator family protein [Candidatus Methylomirabilis sp.]
MLKQNKKRNIFIGIFLTPYFLTFICILVLTVVAGPIYRNAIQRYQVDNEIAALQKQISDLQASNDDLTKLKTYLQSDQFVEKEARLNLGLRKQGEQVVVVEGANGGAKIDSGALAVADKKNSNAVKWWNYFFSK